MRISSLLCIFFLFACSQGNSDASSSTLKQFLEGSNKPAVLKFYADWCDSCKEYAPVFAKVQSTQSKAIDFYAIDIDDKKNAKLIKELKISRIPVSYFVSKDRQRVSKELGPLSEAELKANIQKLLI